MKTTKTIISLVVGIIFAIVLTNSPIFKIAFDYISQIGVIGIFVTGFLFSSSLTVGTGTITLIHLTSEYHPIYVSFIAALGSMACDVCIFRYIKRNIPKKAPRSIPKILKNKFIHWTLPILGALIIASPLPDELGITLLGISNMKTAKFIVLSFCLNVAGLLLLTTTATILS